MKNNNLHVFSNVLTTLYNSDEPMTVEKVKSLFPNIAMKQIRDELRRITEWSLLGQKYIIKEKVLVTHTRKNGKIGNPKPRNSYFMDPIAKQCPLDVLSTMARCFNHHNMAIAIKRSNYEIVKQKMADLLQQQANIDNAMGTASASINDVFCEISSLNNMTVNLTKLKKARPTRQQR